MSRIGIDVRCLVEGRRTGVEEYTLNLLEKLFQIDSKNTYVLFLNSLGVPKADLSWVEKYSNVSIKKFRYPNKILNLLFWYLRWPKIDKMLGGVDLIFFPNIIFGNVSKKAKILLTIHDLSFERYPETFSWKRRFWHSFVNPKSLCKKATKIIAVSESTKNDLISLYRINNEKVAVIHSGIDKKFRIIDRNDGELIKVKEKYRLPYKFILYFGTIEPRKNLIGVIQAFNHLQKYALKNNNENLLKYRLVIAGQKGWLGEEIYKEIKEAEFNNKILIKNNIPDGDKEYIFNLASLFVYPSFFEGFGFPPLEAMACGVPTIVSNNSSLPEVVGKNAIMIDPDKPDELWKAMQDILSSEELYQKMKDAGLKRAQEFNWQKTARETLAIVNELGK